MKGFEHMATSGTHRPREAVRREYAEALTIVAEQLAGTKLSKEKRRRVVEKALADPEFGEQFTPALNADDLKQTPAGRLQRLALLESAGLLDAAGVPTNIPMKTPNSENQREHWATKAKRVAAQRGKMRREVAKWLEARGPLLRITLTRVAPRRVDPTNLGSCLKAAVDGLSDALRLDDGSRAVEWVLKQRKGQATVEWEVKAL